MQDNVTATECVVTRANHTCVKEKCGYFEQKLWPISIHQ